jgi:hypothetical protein
MTWLYALVAAWVHWLSQEPEAWTTAAEKMATAAAANAMVFEIFISVFLIKVGMIYREKSIARPGPRDRQPSSAGRLD